MIFVNSGACGANNCGDRATVNRVCYFLFGGISLEEWWFEYSGLWPFPQVMFHMIILDSIHIRLKWFELYYDMFSWVWAIEIGGLRFFFNWILYMLIFINILVLFDHILALFFIYLFIYFALFGNECLGKLDVPVKLL